MTNLPQFFDCTDAFCERRLKHSPLSLWGDINQLHIIKELQEYEYCKPGYPLYECSFADIVDLTQNIYMMYGTTQAATFAQHHNTTIGVMFFNSCMAGVHSCPPSTSPPIPPQPTMDLDDGISFLNASNLDEDIPSPSPDPTVLADSVFCVSSDNPPLSDKQSQGNTLLYNNTILYCDLLHLYKFNTSIHDGDIGHAFEVIHISSLSNSGTLISSY